MSSYMVRLTNYILFGIIVVLLVMVFKPGGLIKSANQTINTANIFQISQALELYYFDNEHYPATTDSQALFKALSPYLRKQPNDAGVFVYEPTDFGQNYHLDLR